MLRHEDLFDPDSEPLPYPPSPNDPELENRMADPALTPADKATDAANTPALGAIVPPSWAKYLTIAAVVIGGVASLPSLGIALPAAVVAGCTIASSLLVALGIASPGIRKV